MSDSLVNILKTCIALTVVAFTILFIRTTDFGQVISALQDIGPRWLWVMVSTFCAYLLASIGWQYCIGKTARNIPMWKLFMVRLVGEKVSLFNPTSIVGGDLMKVMLLRDGQTKQTEVVGSVIISRLMMIVTQLTLFIIAMLCMTFVSGKSLVIEAKLMLIATSVCLLLIVLGYYFLLPTRERQNSSDQKNNKIGRLLDRLKNIRAQLASFYKDRPRDFALAFLFFSLHWIAGSFEFYIIMGLLGYDISVLQALLLDMGVIVIKSTGAFIPGQIGIEEIGNKMMLMLAGFTSGTVWLAVSVLRRFRQLVWLFISAVFYFFLIKTKSGLMDHTDGSAVCKP